MCLKNRCQRNVLFDYAARYWGLHVESTAEEEIKQIALGFLDNSKNVASSGQIVIDDERYNSIPNPRFPMFYKDTKKIPWHGAHGVTKTSLHLTTNLKAMQLTACFGFASLIVALLRRERYTDDKDGDGRTPPSYAAGDGHEAVVRILLDQASFEADCEDAIRRTPLSHVSSSGHVEVEKLLMKRDVAASGEEAQNILKPHGAFLLAITAIDVESIFGRG